MCCTILDSFLCYLTFRRRRTRRARQGNRLSCSQPIPGAVALAIRLIKFTGIGTNVITLSKSYKGERANLRGTTRSWVTSVPDVLKFEAASPVLPGAVHRCPVISDSPVRGGTSAFACDVIRHTHGSSGIFVSYLSRLELACARWTTRSAEFRDWSSIVCTFR